MTSAFQSQPVRESSVPSELAVATLVEHVLHFPTSLIDAWEAASTYAEDIDQCDSLLIAGMGGSAGAGDLVAALASSSGTNVDVRIHRGYDLPRWLTVRSVVCCCSYSGSTEETVSVFRQAMDRGLTTCIVAAGGHLLSEAARHNLPAFRIDYLSPPRHSLGWSLPPLLRLASHFGAIDLDDRDFRCAAADLELAMPSLVIEAREIAEQLCGRIPVIYGAEHLVPVARRWKNQLNENANTVAFFDEMPEANHNSIVGLDLPEANRTTNIFLTSSAYGSRNALRMELSSGLYRTSGAQVLVVEAGGGSWLVQQLRLVVLGDLVSLWTAALCGVDAHDIHRIDELKRALQAIPADSAFS